MSRADPPVIRTPRDFLATGSEATTSDWLARFLGVGLSVATDGIRSIRLRRTWMDTFDWDLDGAGLELEQLVLGSTTTIELRRSGLDDGAPEAPALSVATSDAIAFPALAPDAVPEGPVRARIAKVTGIRALQPTARFTGRRRTVGVVNDDAKTVARIQLDDGRAAGSTTGPARVSVVALRGYGRQADRVAARLAAIPELVPAPDSCYDASLKAAGRHRGDTGGVDKVTMTPGMAAADAIAAVLGSFLATVETNLAGVVTDVDTEFLHDLRVAVRKARSAVKLVGDVIPADLEQLGESLRWLGDATSPARDLDVHLLGLPGISAQLRAARVGDLGPFAAHLARRRAEALGRLVTDLRSPRFRRLLQQWRAIAALSTGSSDQPDPVLTVGELASERLGRAHQRLLRLGARVTDDSPAEELHSLRKRGKEYRYLLEIFEPVESSAIRKRVEPVLKSLQDCLGAFQDSEVQAVAIRTYAEEMMRDGATPSATLLAMGELAAQLDTEQQGARDSFARLFAAFASVTREVRWGSGGEGS